MRKTALQVGTLRLKDNVLILLLILLIHGVFRLDIPHNDSFRSLDGLDAFDSTDGQIFNQTFSIIEELEEVIFCSFLFIF
jgi:hypothetical protein